MPQTLDDYYSWDLFRQQRKQTAVETAVIQMVCQMKLLLCVASKRLLYFFPLEWLLRSRSSISFSLLDVYHYKHEVQHYHHRSYHYLKIVR